MSVKEKVRFFNKSTITNLIALGIIVGGYFSPYFRRQILYTGVFALSGALTNWLAVFMLFEKVPLLYGSGVIPNRFEDIKTGIGNLVMSEFFADHKIEKLTGELEKDIIAHVDLNPIIDKIDYNQVYDEIKLKIRDSKMGPMLGMFGGDRLLEKFRTPFIANMKEYVQREVNNPDLLRNLFSENKENVQKQVAAKIEKIVQDRLNELTPEKTKEIMQKMIREHLGWLVVWGGVFGGLIGLGTSFIPGI